MDRTGPRVRRRLALTVLVFGGVAVAAVVLGPLVGSTRISLARVFDRSIPFAENTDAQIFFVARLPRVLAATLIVVGIAGVIATLLPARRAGGVDLMLVLRAD